MEPQTQIRLAVGLGLIIAVQIIAICLWVQ